MTGDRRGQARHGGRRAAAAVDRGGDRRGNPAPPPAEAEPPGTDQLRDLTSQGHGPRKIARITGCSERAIRQLLTSARLRPPIPPSDGGTDPRKVGIHIRHGVASRAHPLAALGGLTRSPQPSGTPSPAQAPSSASEGSLSSPASPASGTLPASSVSGTPSSPARSGNSRPSSAPRSCAPDQTGGSR